MAGRPRGMSLTKRFMEKVKAESLDECWEWQASLTRGGYGHFGIQWPGKNYTMERSHRTSYKLFKGPIPEGMLVCHQCDNPLCVNPKHLFLGTHKDNAMDMMAKGRKNKEKRENRLNRRHLTQAEADSIRADHEAGLSYTELMQKYDTSRPQICRVVLRQIWP